MRYAKYKKTGIAWLPEVPEGEGSEAAEKSIRAKT